MFPVEEAPEDQTIEEDVLIMVPGGHCAFHDLLRLVLRICIVPRGRASLSHRATLLLSLCP